MSDSSAPSAPVAGIALYWLVRALMGSKSQRSANPYQPPRAPLRPAATATARLTGPPLRLLAMPGPVTAVPPFAFPFPPGLRTEKAAPVPKAQWTSGREMLAWRAWRLAYWKGEPWPHLVSMGVPWVWGGPVLRADQLPDVGPMNRSGVHAIKPQLYGRLDWVWTEHVRVVGWVALSGRVVEHELGYRAERAVIRKLRFSVGMHLVEDRLPALRRIASQLEDHYQAPVKMGWTERRIAQRLRAGGYKPEFPHMMRCSAEHGWRIG